MTPDKSVITRHTGVARPAILALGFRPFYLLAMGFALLALPAWLLLYAGMTPLQPAVPGVLWHIHEMLFGFATAVIAGFLLTAVRNWTGQPTTVGAGLALLALLWVGGRVLMITGPVEIAALVDGAFLPALGIAIAVPIWRSRNVRNYKVFGIIVLLSALNAAFHLAYIQVVPGHWLPAIYKAGLDVVALLIAVIAGRVIPVFTANAISEAHPRRFPALEAAAIGALLGIIFVDLAAPWWRPPPALWLGLLALAAAAHGVRLAFWSPLLARRNALLLMLPVAYAWLPIHFGLRALGEAALITPVAATHALTVGAMVGMMVAMMMRSALGHTGRVLKAGVAEVAAFVLIQLSAVVRVAGAGLEWGRANNTIAGILFTVGFLILLGAYAPKLVRPRIDGRPG